MKTKILLLGGSGFIGTHLAEKFCQDPQNLLVASYFQHHLEIPRAQWLPVDATSPHNLSRVLTEISPDIIINCIAMSRVDLCEQNESQCKQINVQPSIVIAEYCRNHPKTKNIFFSSSQVFSGAKNASAERDLPNPANKYGHSKLHAEEITKACPHYAIIRPCFVYGIPRPFQHGNLFYNVYKTIKEGKEFRAYTDMIRSPCYIRDMIKVVERVITMNKSGIFHVPSEPTSIYHFAQEIVSFFHLNQALLAKEQSAGKEPVWRARNTALDSTWTERELALSPTSHQQAFAELQVMLP